MPTILLQEIRDFLYAMLTRIAGVIDTINATLNNINEDTSSIDRHVKSIDGNVDDIRTEVEGIHNDTSDISDDTNVLANDGVTALQNIDASTSSIDSKCTTILRDLTTGNTYLYDVKTNTASLITPVSRINENVLAIKTNSDGVKSDLDTVALYTPVISQNAGTTATYAEEIATNTLNAYNKLYTISEDTTQLRADNQVIIGLLQNQTVIHGDNVAIINLLTDILTELRGTQT